MKLLYLYPMKLKLTFTVLVLALLFSCQKDKKVTEEPIPKVENPISEVLNVQSFSALPELSDCYTYIAENKENFESENFIFADDYGNNAYLKINDEILKIPLEEGDFDPSDLEREVHFENGKIQIKLEPVQLDESEEQFIFQGQMTIEQDGKVFTTTIYGESSC